MSGKPRDFGAFLKARSAQISRKIAELKQQLTELDDTKAEDERELRELEKLQADITEFEQALDIALHWPPSREQMGKMVRDGFLDPEHLKSSRPLPVKFDFAYDKKKNQIKRVPKSGRRPPRWKGRDGYEFVSGVLTIQAQDKCSVAEAIRKLKKAEPGKWPEAQRSLERRFQEANRYWESWYQLQVMLESRLRDLLAKAELKAKKEV